MTKRKKLMDVVFILDRSGSMRGTENDTIGGYNGYINDFKSKKEYQNLFVQLILIILKR